MVLYINPLAGMKKSHLLESRNLWKQKSQIIARELRNAKKRERRKDLKIEALKEEVRATRAGVSVTSAAPPNVTILNVRIEIRIMCVMLFILGKVPCNAIHRILAFLTSSGHLPFQWVPDPSSLVNWVARAGLGMLHSVGIWTEPWVCIVDHTIAFGKAKAMVVLRVPLSVMSSGEAPTLADAQCIGVEIKETWNGDEVCKSLLAIFAVAGLPAAILKDGGTDLAKAATRIRELHPTIELIHDVGHVIANALKAKYSQKKLFKILLEIANSGRKRLFLTVLTTLRPPKIRTKGRFQSISKLLKWAQEMQMLLSGGGRPAKGSLREKLSLAVTGLCKLKAFVENFSAECSVLNEIQKTLKSQGLNQSTYQQVSTMLKQLPRGGGIRETMSTWLSQTLRTQCRLGIGQTPLLVSSDIIECLMGQLKHILERTPIPEFSSLTLAVPLLCGKPSTKSVQTALENCPHKMLTSWRSQNCAHSERHVRQRLIEEIIREPVQKTVPRQAT